MTKDLKAPAFSTTLFSSVFFSPFLVIFASLTLCLLVHYLPWSAGSCHCLFNLMQPVHWSTYGLSYFIFHFFLPFVAYAHYRQIYFSLFVFFPKVKKKILKNPNHFKSSYEYVRKAESKIWLTVNFLIWAQKCSEADTNFLLLSSIGKEQWDCINTVAFVFSSKVVCTIEIWTAHRNLPWSKDSISTGIAASLGLCAP